jgi:hypothetical protein
MSRVNAPPVVHKHVEEGEENNEEGGGPFGLETDCNHDASGKSDNGEHKASECPFSLKGDSNEEEDQKDTTS